jgi:hypothetical protein
VRLSVYSSGRLNHTPDIIFSPPVFFIIKHTYILASHTSSSHLTYLPLQLNRRRVGSTLFPSSDTLPRNLLLSTPAAFTSNIIMTEITHPTIKGKYANSFLTPCECHSSWAFLSCLPSAREMQILNRACNAQMPPLAALRNASLITRTLPVQVSATPMIQEQQTRADA